MRIVFLASELFSIGGIQRQNRLVITALDELVTRVGGAMRVLALNDPAPVDWGTELGALQSTSITCFGKRRLAFIRRALSESRDADLAIYGLLGFAPITFAAAVLGHTRRCLLMLYGIEAWTYRSRGHALALRNMHGYIAISRYTLDRFSAAYHLDGNQPGFVLPNVVSPCLLDDVPDLVEQGNVLNLLTVSRMAKGDEYKGIDTVVNALPSLLVRFPKLRYVLIGDGVDRMRIERLAQSLGVEKNIDFLGHVSEEDLRKTYRQCTLFVMPSAKEGFGFVFIEAMAYGKPVIAAKSGATPEVVNDGETGILIEYGNVTQLVQAIETLLNDSNLRRKMGQAGIQTVKTCFSYAALKANLIEILAACGFPLPSTPLSTLASSIHEDHSSRCRHA